MILGEQGKQEQSKTGSGEQYCCICGQLLDKSYRFCPCCGGELPLKRCSGCGSPRPWGANYCPNCGQKY